jgi:ribosomal protein S12 methylthiotransferase
LPSPRVYLHTLGCPKNEADSAVLASRLSAAGVTIVEQPEAASHIVVNTCGFTSDAKEESIAEVLAAAEGYRGADLIVMGCLVQRYRQELEQGFPEVAHWFGLGEGDAMLEALAGEGPIRRAPGAAGAALGPQHPRSFAYIKISDGCDHLCSFCAIPGIKGPYAPLSLADIEEQVEAALAAGARELVLVGQDTTIWRADGLDLAGLVERLAADAQTTWIRLMYLQPEHVDDRLLDLVACHPTVVRYLDVPFQHASGAVLGRMRRRGDAGEYRALLDHARRMMPDVSLRSTFIVGFPGEGEAEFRELLDFAEWAGFDHAGVFVYSPEEGTPAYGLRPRVPARVARERLGRLSAILASSTERANRALVGNEVEVIVDSLGEGEGLEGTVAMGRTYRQAPDVDGVTFLEGDLPLGTVSGHLVRAVITEAVGSDLVAWCDTTQPT